MVDRALFGSLGGGVYGFRCSRPGFAVKTATKGQLLYDTSGIVFQKVLSGETTLLHNQNAGSYNITGPTLPAEYASYSNLHMWANVYFQLRWTFQNPPDVDSDLDLTSLETVNLAGNTTNLLYGVEGGVIKFSITTDRHTLTGTSGGNTANRYIKSSWAVFNALMS